MDGVEPQNPSKPAQRDKTGRWAAGNNGNPGGRPAILREVRELAQSHCAEAIRTLHELMTTSGDERVRLSAADSILDRGIGKPLQSVDVAIERADNLGIAEARDAAQALLVDPEARAALRAALRGEDTSSTSDFTKQDPASPYLTVRADIQPGRSMIIGEAPVQWVWFKGVLAKYKRIAIAGGPRTGKTTLSDRAVGRVEVFHGDDYISDDWSANSAEIVRLCTPLPSFVVEGVQVPRALRKGLIVDAVIWLDRPQVPLTKAQQTMAKGVATVFAEWRAANPSVPVLVPE